MKRFFMILIPVLFIVLVLLLTVGIVSKAGRVRRVSERIMRLPDFSFLTLDGAEFRSEDIERGPLLIVRFHPDCEHCHYEISELIRNQSDLSDGMILLISYAPADSIRKFLSLFSGFGSGKIIPLADPSFAFGEIFGTDVVPSNFIYDRDLNLVKVLYGEVKSETIIRYMRNEEDQ
ncbi:MAG: redoxin domain-containing protein [Bacteroidales bacterium]|nr:redoxin domain-containing protein [Bacteroidales bacterium]